MKKTVLLLIGETKSGKTTLSKEFSSELKYTHIHCIGPTKRLLEQTFNLPVGSLDDQSTKTLTVPGAKTPEFTYQQALADLFHFWDDRIGGSYGANSLLNQITSSPNHKFIVDSVRNPLEVELLVNEPSITIDTILISRRSSVNYSSDQYLEDNIASLQKESRIFFTFDNNSHSIEQSYNLLSCEYLQMVNDLGLKF